MERKLSPRGAAQARARVSALRSLLGPALRGRDRVCLWAHWGPRPTRTPYLGIWALLAAPRASTGRSRWNPLRHVDGDDCLFWFRADPGWGLGRTRGRRDEPEFRTQWFPFRALNQESQRPEPCN